MRHKPFYLPIATAAALGACTVGPNYAGPPVISPGAKPAGFVRAGDIAATPDVARWWEALGDPTLNALIARALAANPNVAVMEARFRQASAAFRLEKSNSLPTVSPTAIYAHARIPGLNLNNNNNSGTNSNSSGGSSDINLYNLGFQASWEVDLFGGQRRTIEAARANAQAAEASVADAQVSLSAQVAQAYVNLRDRQLRIALSSRSAAMQAQMLELTRQRFGRGAASRLDVVRLETQLSNTRADLTPLNAEREAFLNALAVLTGDAPGTLDQTLSTAAPAPFPPAAIAVGDPAQLLQRRPDIRAAERKLAASTANVGKAEAARFPRLSLLGIIGVGGTSPSDLTKLDDFAAIAAPQLSWSFLDFGRNRARINQAKAARDETEAQYRATVLTALQDAEDSLSRFRNRRISVATLARAKASADEAALLSQQRYRAGTSTLIDLLDAQRQQLAAAQNLSLAKAQLTGDFIAIQKALGFGWSAAPAGT